MHSIEAIASNNTHTYIHTCIHAHATCMHTNTDMSPTPPQVICFSVLSLSACLRPRPPPPGPDNLWHFEHVKAMDLSVRRIAGQAIEFCRFPFGLLMRLPLSPCFSPPRTSYFPARWTALFPDSPSSPMVRNLCCMLTVQALLPSPTASAAHAINLASSQDLVIIAVDNQDPPQICYATQATLDLWVQYPHRNPAYAAQIFDTLRHLVSCTV